jgi:hypothetical protein
VLPATVLLTFYALATPYEPRWSAVVDAVAVIAALTVLQALVARRFRSAPKSAVGAEMCA